MTQTVRAIVGLNGKIELPPMPQAAGKAVEVTISVAEETETLNNRETAKAKLRGSVTRYDDPYGPALPADEWEALQ